MATTDKVKGAVLDLMRLMELYSEHKELVDELVKRIMRLRDRLEDLGESPEELKRARDRFAALDREGDEEAEPDLPADGPGEAEPEPVPEPEPSDPVLPEPPADPGAPLYQTVLHTFPDPRLLTNRDAVFMDSHTAPTKFYIVENGLQWERYVHPPEGQGFHPAAMSVESVVGLLTKLANSATE